MARFCTECGSAIADGVSFCTECGTKAPDAVPAAEAPAAPPTTYCTNCGTELTGESAFCTECGAARNAAEAPPQPTPEPPPPAPAPPLRPAPPAPAPPLRPAPPAPAPAPIPQPAPVPAQDTPPKGGKYGVLGTGTYVGLMLLFALPIIGFLACILMAFLPKNQNIKHYARAKLIWTIILLVLVIVLVIAAVMLIGTLLDQLNEMIGGSFSDFGDLLEEFGNLSEILEEVQGSGLNGLPIE